MAYPPRYSSGSYNRNSQGSHQGFHHPRPAPNRQQFSYTPGVQSSSGSSTPPSNHPMANQQQQQQHAAPYQQQQQQPQYRNNRPYHQQQQQHPPPPPPPRYANSSSRPSSMVQHQQPPPQQSQSYQRRPDVHKNNRPYNAPPPPPPPTHHRGRPPYRSDAPYRSSRGRGEPYPPRRSYHSRRPHGGRSPHRYASRSPPRSGSPSPRNTSPFTPRSPARGGPPPRSYDRGGGPPPLDVVDKQAKRLYIGNIPSQVSEPAIEQFVNHELMSRHLAQQPGPPCVSSRVNHDRGYIFVEFRTIDETTAALALNGVSFQGKKLLVKRPNAYVSPTSIRHDLLRKAILSSLGKVDPYVIFVGSPFFNATSDVDDLRQLFLSVGPLSHFSFFTSPFSANDGSFFRYALVLMAEENHSELAVEKLHRSRLSHSNTSVTVKFATDVTEDDLALFLRLTVPRPASDLLSSSSNFLQVLPHLPSVHPTSSSSHDHDDHRVLVLYNILPISPLDDDAVADIQNAITERCSSIGPVDHVSLSSSSPLPGPAYVIFKRDADASQAVTALSGCLFDGHLVMTSLISFSSFQQMNL